MSKREREFGTLSFTKSGYIEVVRKLRSDYNAYIKELKEAALTTYEILSLYPKSKQREIYDKMTRKRFNCLSFPRGDFFATLQDIGLIESELFRGANNRLTKPRAKMFKTLTNKEKTFTLELSDARFCFSENSDGSGLCVWDTQYGSNNVSSIEDSKVYKLVCNVLLSRKWRRNEGGLWLYRDENYEDSYCDHLFPDEVVHVFGPVGESKMKERASHF